MYQERKKLGFELLISNLFSNLGGLIFTNMLFLLPFLGSIAIAWAIYHFLLPVFIIVMPLSLVLASPFYAGVVLISRDYSQNIDTQSKAKAYFKAVKENGFKYLIIGILGYVSILSCYFGVKVYSTMAALSGIFYVMMFFILLMSVFFLFFFFAAPLMTVSFDLKTKDIIKNSALMTFGELKKNFFATIGVVAYLGVVLFPMIVLPYLTAVLSVQLVKIILIAYLGVALGLLIPAPCALIISHYLYPNMKAVIAGEGVPSFTITPKEKEDTAVSEKKEEITPSPKEIEGLSKGDGDEYIFYQGKMIKRKFLIKILKDKENDNE